jgi:hypothetical protein
MGRMVASSLVVGLLFLAGCGGPAFQEQIFDPLQDAAVTDEASSPPHGDAAPAPEGSVATDAGVTHQDARSGDDAPPPPGCGGVCAPQVPAGWSGPVELAVGSAAPPTCGSAYQGSSWVSYDGLSAPDATCGCTCDAPTGFTCSVEVTSVVTPGCTVPTGPPMAYASGQCDVGGYNNVSTPTVAGGACQPNGSAAVPPTSWSGEARACAPTQAPGLCSQGVCMPALDPTFLLCIEQAGDQACPSGYPNKRTEYASVSDTRGCSACTCGAPSGISCGGRWTWYSDRNCQTALASSSLPANCTGSNQSAEYQAAPSGGSCGASGSSPTGSAQGAGAQTFCCK